MLWAAGTRVVSSEYWFNLIVYGDSELALIAFHRTSTWRKYKQVGGHGTALPNTSLKLKEISWPSIVSNAAFSFIVKRSQFVKEIGSVKSTTRRQRQYYKFCIFNEQTQELCTPFTCCFFISVHFFPFLGEFVTSNDHFSSFTENLNTQARIWIFFSSFDTVAALNSVPG